MIMPMTARMPNLAQDGRCFLLIVLLLVDGPSAATTSVDSPLPMR